MRPGQNEEADKTEATWLDSVREFLHLLYEETLAFQTVKLVKTHDPRLGALKILCVGGLVAYLALSIGCYHSYLKVEDQPDVTLQWIVTPDKYLAALQQEISGLPYCVPYPHVCEADPIPQRLVFQETFPKPETRFKTASIHTEYTRRCFGPDGAVHSECDNDLVRRWFRQMVHVEDLQLTLDVSLRAHHVSRVAPSNLQVNMESLVTGEVRSWKRGERVSLSVAELLAMAGIRVDDPLPPEAAAHHPFIAQALGNGSAVTLRAWGGLVAVEGRVANFAPFRRLDLAAHSLHLRVRRALLAPLPTIVASRLATRLYNHSHAALPPPRQPCSPSPAPTSPSPPGLLAPTPLRPAAGDVSRALMPMASPGEVGVPTGDDSQVAWRTPQAMDFESGIGFRIQYIIAGHIGLFSWAMLSATLVGGLALAAATAALLDVTAALAIDGFRAKKRDDEVDVEIRRLVRDDLYALTPREMRLLATEQVWESKDSTLSMKQIERFKAKVAAQKARLARTVRRQKPRPPAPRPQAGPLQRQSSFGAAGEAEVEEAQEQAGPGEAGPRERVDHPAAANLVLAAMHPVALTELAIVLRDGSAPAHTARKLYAQGEVVGTREVTFAWFVSRPHEPDVFELLPACQGPCIWPSAVHQGRRFMVEVSALDPADPFPAPCGAGTGVLRCAPAVRAEAARLLALQRPAAFDLRDRSILVVHADHLLLKPAAGGEWAVAPMPLRAAEVRASPQSPVKLHLAGRKLLASSPAQRDALILLVEELSKNTRDINSDDLNASTPVSTGEKRSSHALVDEVNRLRQSRRSANLRSRWQPFTSFTEQASALTANPDEWNTVHDGESGLDASVLSIEASDWPESDVDDWDPEELDRYYSQDSSDASAG